MEAIAKLNNVPTSPRKMRLVADLVRGERVNKALNILKFEPKQGAARIEKLLLSAISNWQQKNEDVDLEEFADEIDGWILDELKAIGCDTAKSVLDISVADLAKRTDLEEETILEVFKILQSEFE